MFVVWALGSELCEDSHHQCSRGKCCCKLGAERLGGWQPRPLRQERRRRREPQTVESKIRCECFFKAGIGKCTQTQTSAFTLHRRTPIQSNQRLEVQEAERELPEAAAWASQVFEEKQW